MYKSQIISVVVGVFVTFALNLSISYIQLNKGYVLFGEPFTQQKQTLYPVDIVNQSKETLKSLQFLVPEKLNIKSILTSRPLIIKELDNTLTSTGQKVIELSGITSESSVRLLIPIEPPLNSCCELLNFQELNLEKRNDADIENPVSAMFLKAIVNSLVYTVVLSAFSFWMHLKIKNVFKEYKQEIKEIEESVKEYKQGYKELNILYKRQRYMLLRRINEYSKELNFWRMSIRKQLLGAMTPKEVDEKLLSVSANLDTRSTHGNINREYEDLEINIQMAEEISEKIQ
ncbi:hypothetical protein V8065_001133 [Vibrio parahaemolyticus]